MNLSSSGQSCVIGSDVGSGKVMASSLEKTNPCQGADFCKIFVKTIPDKLSVYTVRDSFRTIVYKPYQTGLLFTLYRIAFLPL